MSSCAIFGHSDYKYEQDRAKIETGLLDLIKRHFVTEFLVGLRGNFDLLCIESLRKLKKEYPHLRLIHVWSYIPQENKVENVEGLDGSVYLLERQAPPLYAIVETNKSMVKKADYIFSGVVHCWGGAWRAVEYAKKQGKIVVEPLGDYE